VGKKEGTPHFHAYFRYENPRLVSAIRKLFPGAHVDIPRGTPPQIRHYVAKLTVKESPEEKPAECIHETGELPAPGTRSDLREVADMVVKGVPLAEVAEQQPALFVQYSRGLSFLRNVTFKDRDCSSPPVCVWVYGTTGVGKTRLAIDIHGVDCCYIKDGTQWWDGYQQQEAIIVDDFDGRWPFRDLLRFLDRYPYQGQCKGGYVKVNSPYIYFTCEFSPAHFWVDNELAQVTRRLTGVFKLE